MSKILIGTPFKDAAADDFIKCLIDMVIYTQNQGHEVEFTNEHGGLFDARDRICRRTMREQFDYMLQLDSDMTFPPDALCKMLERDVDVVTGVYVGKEENHKPILFTELHKDDENCGPYALKHGLGELLKKDLFEQPVESLSELEKYDLVYNRILLQKPGVVFCVRPFKGTDMELREHIRHLITLLQKKQIAVVLLTTNAAEVFGIADRIIRVG